MGAQHNMQMPLGLAKKGTEFTLERYERFFNKKLLIDRTPATFTGNIFRFIINSHWRDIEKLTKIVRTSMKIL